MFRDAGLGLKASDLEVQGLKSLFKNKQQGTPTQNKFLLLLRSISDEHSHNAAFNIPLVLGLEVWP